LSLHLRKSPNKARLNLQDQQGTATDFYWFHWHSSFLFSREVVGSMNAIQAYNFKDIEVEGQVGLMQ